MHLRLNALKILFSQTTGNSSFAKEAEDAFVLTQLIFDALWNNQSAVEEGFANFVKRRTKEIENALCYHSRNCSSYCVICADLELIGVSNERKKPRLCA